MLRTVAGRAACVCAGVLVVSGMAACGGDEGSKANEGLELSAANEPPRVFAERLAKLLATTTAKRDCRALDELNGRSLTAFPCPAGEPLKKSMKRFAVVGVKEYGTGAIVDYTSGEAKTGAAIVLFVAPDRNWAVSQFGVITEPSTDTGDEKSRAGFRKAVYDYLAAVRERDCKAFAAVTFTGIEDTKEVCTKAFPRTRDLAKRLKANPSTTPRYQGGNARYGFYGLETPKPFPENTTISIIESTPQSPRPYVVLDAAPSPTADQQAEVKSLNKKGDVEPERSKSRKADGQ